MMIKKTLFINLLSTIALSAQTAAAKPGVMAPGATTGNICVTSDSANNENPIISQPVIWSRPAGYTSQAITNSGTYKKEDRDVLFKSGGDNQELTCNFGFPNVTAWHITCDFAYPEGGEAGENYMEVLDSLDRVIVRFGRQDNWPNLELLVNNERMAFGPDVYGVVNKLHPMLIDARNDSVTVTYADYPPVQVALFDATANIHAPHKLHFVQRNVYGRGHQTNFARGKFFPY